MAYEFGVSDNRKAILGLTVSNALNRKNKYQIGTSLESGARRQILGEIKFKS